MFPLSWDSELTFRRSFTEYVFWKIWQNFGYSVESFEESLSVIYYLCLKRTVLCNCLCSSSSSFFQAALFGTLGCKSVFMISKISQYGQWRWCVQLFPRYSCKNWYENGVSTFIKPVTTNSASKYIKRIQLKWEYSSRRWSRHHVQITWQTKQIISPLPECFWSPSLVDKLGQVMTYREGVPSIKLHESWTTWLCEIT